IQYGKRINRRGILFTLMLSAFIWSCLPVSALAAPAYVVENGNGLARNSSRYDSPLCPVGGDFISTGPGAAIVGNGCNIWFDDVYVPKDGMYFIRFYVGLRENHAIRDYGDSTKFYLVSSKAISQQTEGISITTTTKYLSSQLINQTVDFCDVLVDSQGNEYSLVPGDACA
ncbi:TPA: hypothetical protein U2I12_004755, partial [Citrobacter farmeri]|nr:hypothetical protein [Citrobacter farmeri]